MHVIRFLATRIIVYLLVVWIGVTIIFFVPRFVPGNPVDAMLGKMMSQGTTMDPKLVESMRQTLTELFGLEGTLWEQYSAFLQRVLLTRDFGPSLSYYPTPVSMLIAKVVALVFRVDVDSVGDQLDVGQSYRVAGRLPQQECRLQSDRNGRHDRVPDPVLHSCAGAGHSLCLCLADLSLCVPGERRRRAPGPGW